MFTIRSAAFHRTDNRDSIHSRMATTTQLAFLLAVLCTIAGAENAKPSYTKPEEYVSIVMDGDNELRAAKGLPPLCTNKKLQAVAEKYADMQGHSDYFVDSGEFLVHDYVTDGGFDWDTAVGNFWIGGPNASSFVGGKFSLDNYTMVGTAYAFYDGFYGIKHFWVQVFATSCTEECDPEVDSVNNSSKTGVPGHSEASSSDGEGIPGTVSPTTGHDSMESPAAKTAMANKTEDCN